MSQQNLDQQQLWQRYCEFFSSYPELGISIDISRMRFADDLFEKMRPAVESAFDEMKALEAGEIANADEKRMVGHYWLRDTSIAPSKEISTAIETELGKIKDFAAKVHSSSIKPQSRDKFTKIVIVGIGGSALGPQLISDALWNQADPISLHFIDNTDPDGIARTLTKLDDSLAETLTIVISKSGGTVETRNGMLEAEHAYQKAGLDFSKHVVAITCDGSKLDGIAKEAGWLDQFYIWDWVGGRTSVFSAVGLLPAALQGNDIDAFIDGAKEMDAVTRVNDSRQNPAALLAQMWFVAGEGKGAKDMVVLPYKDRIMLLSKYLQQLVMESLGKEKDRDGEIVHQGIAVYGNKGSTDQHAYVQQLRDGVNNFFATFIEVLEDYTTSSDNVSKLEVEQGITSGDYLNGFFQGTRTALYENERDSITITIDRLNAKSLGALIALYDRAVGLYASLVNINAYHQPGVEAGKKAAAQVIELQKSVSSFLQKEASSSVEFNAEEIAEAINSPSQVESIYKILEHLSSNPHRGVKRSGGRNPKERKYSLLAK